MWVSGRSKILLALAWLLVVGAGASPVRSQGTGGGIAHDGPGRGALAGFVISPQTAAAGNRALLIAPNGRWFLATSPGAPGARLIEMSHGATLRFLTRPGLHIAELAVSPDSRIVFAHDYDGEIVAWDAATGDVLASPPPTEFHDIARLSFRYDANDEESRPPAELLPRHHLQSTFPELAKFDDITLDPARHHAIIGRIGDPDWKVRIWDLRQEKTEIVFRLEGADCGYGPYAFDYDGKHLVLGNTRGEGDPNHLDIAVFAIDHVGTDGGPNTAKARTILAKCTFRPGFDVRAQHFTISPDAGLISSGAEMPGGPEWTAWDLRSGRKVAAVRPDGYGIVSADDKTIAVLHDLQHAGSRSVQRMTVVRGGRRKTFAIPRSMQSDAWRPVVLSANGRWIASRVNDVVAVWSSDDGSSLHEYRLPGGNISDILRVSDSGDPLLVNDDDGTVLVNGQWRPVRSDQNGLLVPLTPNFHAQCGAIFCDRVIAELGVVERKLVDNRARPVTRQLLSPDGRFMVAGLGFAEGAGYKATDILDIADGRVVMHVDQDQLQFTGDGRYIVAWDRDVGSFVKYELATARRVWTTFPNRIRGGFYMALPDDRLRYSSRRSADVVLVRGFETRPFDAAAARQFSAPSER